MILIDKEKLVEALKTRRYSRSSIKLIDEQPTIEAIPIKWIKKWAEDTFDIESQYDVYPLIKLMLSHWEKENEID